MLTSILAWIIHKYLAQRRQGAKKQYVMLLLLKGKVFASFVENVLNAMKSTFEPDRRYVHELSRLDNNSLVAKKVCWN